MTIEEYERKIREATDASLAAQAINNAAEASAIGSAIGNAGMASGQMLSGGVGEAPEWESQQDQQQKQRAIVDAVYATTTPAEAQQPPENKTIVDTVQREPRGGDGVVSDGNVSAAEAALTKANEDYAKGIADTNEMQNKAFADMVIDFYNEKKAREEEMQRQEQANMLSTMGSSFAELGAGLANLFYVGNQGSHQQYKNYTADWMKKADQERLENRRRRENMFDTMQRLKLQQEQLRAANRIEELKARQAAAKDAYGIARDAYNRALEEKRYADTRSDKDWQRGITERALKMREGTQARQDKATDASIAQGWARINDAKEAREMNMRLYGYVPDKNAPGGFRYDPSQAARGTSSRSSSAGGSGGGLEIPLMAHGNLPAETIRVKDEKALETIIFSNIDAITDLTMMQKDALMAVMEDDTMDADKKARELRRYLVSSGQLRALFRANGNAESGNGADTSDGWLFREYNK